MLKNNLKISCTYVTIVAHSYIMDLHINTVKVQVFSGSSELG